MQVVGAVGGNDAFDLRLLCLPGVSLSLFHGSPVRLARTRALAAESRDDLIFCITFDAPVYVRHGGFEHTFSPGDAHVWMADDDVHCEVPTSYSALLVALERTPELSAADPRRIMRRGGISSAVPALSLLSAYGRSLLGDFERIAPDDAQRHAAHLQDIALMTLGAMGDRRVTDRGAPRTSRLAALKNDIQAHLGHADLSAELVSARHGISSRYMRALFAREGSSFRDYLLECRLLHVYRQLCDPSMSQVSIASLAYDAGFGDLSYFNRVFRRRFGMTPSAARRVYAMPVSTSFAR
jgi:AraC-like DNA-binding protein